MKTSVIMTRKMGDFEVLQRTSDSMFNATKLLEQWNKSSGMQKKIAHFFENEVTKEIIKLISDSNNIKKKEICLKTRGRSDRGGGTWMHYALFSEFASWVSLVIGVLFKNMLIEDGIVDKQPLYSIVRKEKRFLSVIESALSVCNRYNSVYNQYSIGKYFVDMALIYSYIDEFNDENGINKEYKSNKYILIEYDENHHLKPSVSKYDTEREFEICKNLKSKHVNEEINVTIIRISENMESYAYAYLLPYLTGIETSYSFDKACEFLDIRNLISSEHNLDITTENKKYDYYNY